jgi:FkbM family methyltransferase
VHPLVYRLGFRVINVILRFKPAAKSLTAISRAWLRHATLREMLAEQKFDGVIDGGANVGEFAAVVRGVLPGSDLLCVEPQPDCAAALRRQGYRVVEAALWRERGTLTLSQPTSETTSCTVLLATDAAAKATWVVPSIALQDLEISGKQILVKLDLQGAEPITLEGMGSLWERCAGVLSEVTLGRGGTHEVLDRILREHGFREFSTINQLQLSGGRWEADKLWLRR